jgi:hypothetical protein
VEAPLDKRYQVFVSSTFQDLQEERQEVMQALLELDCIPAGMELFPAANLDQWTLIKKVIDDCDYYIVISAGRYGSLGSDGIGYTEMEYRYAVEQSKPIMGFLYRDLGKILSDKSEQSEERRAKLDAFRELIQQKMVRFWESPSDLGSQVSRSLVKLIRTEPAIGWVRATFATTEETTRELLTLRKRIEELERELQRARVTAPEGTEGLAQGEESFDIQLEFRAFDPADYQTSKWTWEVTETWDDIFASIAPLMINEASDHQIRASLNEFVEESARIDLLSDERVRGRTLSGFSIDDTTFNTIKVQLRALGLIASSNKPRSVKNTATYWTLTPRGDALMTRLTAIQRNVGESTKES